MKPILIGFVVLVIVGLAYVWYRAGGVFQATAPTASTAFSVVAPEPYVSLDISKEMQHEQMVFVQPIALQAAKGNPIFSKNPFLAFLEEKANGMNLEVFPTTAASEEEIKAAIPIGASPGKPEGNVSSFSSKKVGNQTFYAYTVTYAGTPDMHVDGILWVSHGKLYNLRNLDGTNPVAGSVLEQTAESFTEK